MPYSQKGARGIEETTNKTFKLKNELLFSSPIKFSMWNVTSMVNKTPKIMEHLLDRQPSIVFISETWLKSNRNSVTALTKTYGYNLLHNIRKNRKKELGGGVGILMKLDICYKRINQKQFSSFEHIVMKVSLEQNKSLILVSIYRVLFVSVTVFLEEIVKLFEVLVTLKDNIILAGDVNIHMDEDELYSNRFKDILDTFNIHQHVNFPTHIQGHTLDIIATIGENPRISCIESNEYDVSHHFLIDFLVEMIPETKQQKVISYRNLKDINPEEFAAEVSNKFDISEGQSFGDGIIAYNDVLREALNKHAPIKSRTIKIVKTAPWFDSEYENLRRQRRKAEKQYQKTKLAVHKENYVNLRKQTTELAHKKKCKHYNDRLDGANNKVLYSTINKLLDNEKDVILPVTKSDADLANSFLNYFTEKVEIIRSTFRNDPEATITNTPFKAQGKLAVFNSVTEDDIRQIVLSFGIKCSPEDPIPADVLKTNVDLFVPFWTKLVNLSLEEGSMACLKNAVVIPLIKQLDEVMDKENLKNYRPVSNLLFVGKLIERVVSMQLNKHMSNNNLHSDFQHGYKKGHSTETLLLKVINDLLIACDKQLPTILMFLDLSAAFDTVDQTKLLEILEDEIGVKGIALKWFSSFLKGRTQKVKIGSTYSNEAGLNYGVAQGSVLGPDLFNIYIRSLRKFIEPSKFSIFGFADDHQLLKTFLPIFQVDAFNTDINSCFKLIEDWMNSFFLQLNASKTKILIIMPPSLRNTITIKGTFINETCVRFVHSANNLGIILDDELSFKNQIQKVVKSCFFDLRRLSKIKDFLTFEQLRTTVSALIFSKLDYCNSLYYGINAVLINKLQYVQNSAARLVKKKNCFNGSTKEYIQKCHWLPIKERIIFKLCLVVHKCLNGTAPSSLADLLKNCSSIRTMKLEQYRYKGVFGNRSFSRVGPKVWNLLPIVIRNESDTTKFKSRLKTFLFDGFGCFVQKLNEH